MSTAHTHHFYNRPDGDDRRASTPAAPILIAVDCWRCGVPVHVSLDAYEGPYAHHCEDCYPPPHPSGRWHMDEGL